MSFLKSKLFIAVLIFVVVLVVVFLVRNNSPDSSSYTLSGNDQNNQIENSSIDAIVTSKAITKTELSKHNTKEDCWVSYNGKVYDLTSFLPNHPGSAAAIAPYCGTAEEFKVAFEKQHGTSKVSVLMKFGTFIGDFQVVGSLN